MFFDLDAFRPVKGANATERFKLARRMQRAFDMNDAGPGYNARMGAILNDFGGPAGAVPGAKRSNDFFDYRAFNKGPELNFGRSPKANLGRTEMARLNDLDEFQFDSALKIEMQTPPAWQTVAEDGQGLSTLKKVGLVAGGVVGGAAAALGISVGVAYAIEPAGVSQFFSEPLETVEQFLFPE